MIGIIIALKQESKNLKKKIKNKKYKFINNKKIILGYIKKKKIVLIESGIGKVLAAISTTLLIQNFKIKYIINIGTSGSLKKNINTRDIIVAKKTKYHDVDITEFGYKIGQIPNNPKIFKCDKNIIKKIKKKLNKKKIYIGKILSGDKFINKYQKLKKKFTNYLSVDMESTSIAQTCYFFQKPFVCIKIISDKSNYNSKKDFYKNINEISKKIRKIIYKII